MIGSPIGALWSLLSLMACGSMLHSQTRPRLDLALTYTAERTNAVGGGNFWLQGGSAEVGVTLRYGLSLAGSFTGTHSKAVGSSGIPLGLVIYTAGPRYSFSPRSGLHGASIFGEALFGGVHGFGSLFPGASGQTSTANAFASQIGGGLDLDLSSRFAIRPIEARWARTLLPNSTTNVQNDLQVSTGITLRWGLSH